MFLYFLKENFNPHLYISIQTIIITGISIALLIKMYLDERKYFDYDYKKNQKK